MQYNYICQNCSTKETIERSYSIENRSFVVKCPKCGNTMRRDWKSSIVVSSECKAENIDQTSWIKECFHNRPSGKTQVLY